VWWGILCLVKVGELIQHLLSSALAFSVALISFPGEVLQPGFQQLSSLFHQHFRGIVQARPLHSS
jgi:hypothetical protein